MRNIAVNQDPAVEALETREWLESLDYVLQQGGAARASRGCFAQLELHARQTGVKLPFTANTPYINTIPADEQAPYPGQPRDRAPHQEPRPLERAGDGRARQQGSKTASAATSRRSRRRRRCTRSASTTSSAARTTATTATSSIFQGHASPGIYARAFLEGPARRRAARELPPRAARRAAGCRRIRTRG